MQSWRINKHNNNITPQFHKRSPFYQHTIKQLWYLYPGGGGESHMKQTGMLVVSLRGVNFGFWSRLECSGQSTNILCHQGLV